MSFESLTFEKLVVRPVVLTLPRPPVVRIATITEWPLILIDLETREGVTGRAYLEPYVVKSVRYLVPALEDMSEMLAGRKVAPVELYQAARKSLHFVGYGGLAMIAASGLDMAAWDALAKAAGVPLCTLLGGSPGPVRAYNSNGLWLKEPAAVAAEAQWAQPIVHPCENQRQDCPTLQMPVPLPQLQPQPSVPGGMQPLGIWLFHPGSPAFVTTKTKQYK